MKWKRARPPWASASDIAAIYTEAKRMSAETGVQYSVDHIVPLLHPLVCGLHCPDNLRIVPLKTNVAKSNYCDLGLQGELYDSLD